MCQSSGVYNWKDVIPKLVQHMPLNIQMYPTAKSWFRKVVKVTRRLVKFCRKAEIDSEKKQLSKSWKQNLKCKSIQRPWKWLFFSPCLCPVWFHTQFCNTFCQSYSMSFVMLLVHWYIVSCVVESHVFYYCNCSIVLCIASAWMVLTQIGHQLLPKKANENMVSSRWVFSSI